MDIDSLLTYHEFDIDQTKGRWDYMDEEFQKIPIKELIIFILYYGYRKRFDFGIAKISKGMNLKQNFVRNSLRRTKRAMKKVLNSYSISSFDQEILNYAANISWNYIK